MHNLKDSFCRATKTHLNILLALQVVCVTRRKIVIQKMGIKVIKYLTTTFSFFI